MRCRSSSLPLIGVTTDIVPPDPVFGLAGYGAEQRLCHAISRAGGVPISLPMITAQIPHYIELLDGIVFSGGGYAAPAHWYGDTDTLSPYASSVRAYFSLALLAGVIEQGMPLLGIYAGMQLISGYLGGRMASNIASAVPSPLNHWRVGAKDIGVHGVVLTQGSRLAALVGSDDLNVNSLHQEAVTMVGDSVRISAMAPDGVVEAIEVIDHPFALGVQWHPEQLGSDQRQQAIIGGLVVAARCHPRRV